MCWINALVDWWDRLLDRTPRQEMCSIQSKDLARLSRTHCCRCGSLDGSIQKVSIFEICWTRLDWSTPTTMPPTPSNGDGMARAQSKRMSWRDIFHHATHQWLVVFDDGSNHLSPRTSIQSTRRCLTSWDRSRSRTRRRMRKRARGRRRTRRRRTRRRRLNRNPIKSSSIDNKPLNRWSTTKWSRRSTRMKDIDCCHPSSISHLLMPNHHHQIGGWLNRTSNHSSDWCIGERLCLNSNSPVADQSISQHHRAGEQSSTINHSRSSPL